MKFSKRWALNLTLIVVTFGMTAGFMQSRSDRPPRVIEEKSWPVAVQEISYTDARPEMVLLGEVEALRVLDITATSEAEITALEVMRGDRVSQDQMLVQLDPQDLQLLLQQKEAELDKLRASMQQEKQQHQSNQLALGQEQQLLQLSQQEQQLILDQRLSAIRQHPPRMAELDARYKSALSERDKAKLESAGLT